MLLFKNKLNMSDIKIKYDGRYPTLCFGHLEVWIDDTYYDFGTNCLISGGRVLNDEDWNMWTEQGLWTIDKDSYPENFPVNKVPELLQVINDELPWGCCGKTSAEWEYHCKPFWTEGCSDAHSHISGFCEE